MRVIKFRAFNEGEMIYPQDEFRTTQSMLSSADILKRFDTVMQYTGLKDRNGKEIYEGDIVKYYSGTYGDIHRWKVASIEYYRSSFGLKDIAWYQDEVLSIKVEIPDLGPSNLKGIPTDIWASDLKQMEVIGNIYQIPELT